ncbi:MAG: DUF2179 domain-containing protein [Planctomycetes bacterium]|nr:DUF2179 domain-containing protein [Planctomycetota bacterium]MCW8134149.1 DUF2179 domain-containing protein [Planctomycetota bacterium]
MPLDFSLSDITLEAVAGGVLIAVARVFDVSLAVLRQASIRNGRAKSAWMLGFVEALIWVFVVASVVKNLTNPVYAVFYALGFATGTFVGVVLEGLLARGEQVVRIFTHNGDKMAALFRTKGFRVTQFEGKGLHGPIQLLFIHVLRKKAPLIPELARDCDPECFLVIDDVRSSSAAFHAAVRK